MEWKTLAVSSDNTFIRWEVEGDFILIRILERRRVKRILSSTSWLTRKNFQGGQNFHFNLRICKLIFRWLLFCLHHRLSRLKAITFLFHFSNLVGLFVIDVSASGLDINQCDVGKDEAVGAVGGIKSFHGTHKCHNTSEVRHDVRRTVSGVGGCVLMLVRGLEYQADWVLAEVVEVGFFGSTRDQSKQNN